MALKSKNPEVKQALASDLKTIKKHIRKLLSLPDTSVILAIKDAFNTICSDTIYCIDDAAIEDYILINRALQLRAHGDTEAFNELKKSNPSLSHLLETYVGYHSVADTTYLHVSSELEVR